MSHTTQKALKWFYKRTFALRQQNKNADYSLWKLKGAAKYIMNKQERISLAKDAYLSGERIVDIAQLLGLSRRTIERYVAQGGWRQSGIDESTDTDSLKNVYLNGEAIASIAQKAGVSRRTIERRVASGRWESERYGKKRQQTETLEEKISERMMCDFLEQNLERIFEYLRLPSAIKIKREYRLTGGRLDFLVFHADNSYSVIEVKAKRPVPCEAVGQLFYYSELLALATGASRENINLIIFSDVDFDATFLNSLKQIGRKITCVKVSTSMHFTKQM